MINFFAPSTVTINSPTINALLTDIKANTANIPLPTPNKIVHSIPMQDTLGTLVWRNLLQNGTYSYTTINGLDYTGDKNLLISPDLQTAFNTKFVEAILVQVDYKLDNGNYSKYDLESLYGNGLKICHIYAMSEPGINYKVGITTTKDNQIGDVYDTIEKGNQHRTIKGYTEMEDFVLHIKGVGHAFITFFKNL